MNNVNPLSMVIFLVLGLAGCAVLPVVAPQPKSEPALGSQVAAAVAQAEIDNEQNVPGPAQDAVRMQLRIARKGLPAPTKQHTAAAAELSSLVFAGQLDAALRKAATSEAEVASLKAQVDREREESKAKLEAEIKRIKSEAEAAQRRLVGYIFFGGSALCLAAGVLLMTVFSGLAMVGPKLVFAAFILAGLLSALGVAILKAMSNPWIIYTGMGVAAAVLIVALVLAYANHQHGKFAALEKASA